MAARPSTLPRVAIGGLGGSGTRLFAATLQAAGIDIGERINDSLDNLWFTLLFKRRAWSRAEPGAAALAEAVDLFRRAMTGGLRGTLSSDELALLSRLRSDLLPGSKWRNGATPEDVDSLIDSGPGPTVSDRPWGWKEPNTHVFLRPLAAAFPGLRYIHVVRDGLDMAFSSNTWQTRHWSHLYGLTHAADTGLPLRQLRYWIAANRAALAYGAAHMPGRFLVMPYEDFCARPDWHWPRLRDFIGLPAGMALPEGLVHPSSIGRGHEHDLTAFPQDVLSAAYALQADVSAFSASA